MKSKNTFSEQWDADGNFVDKEFLARRLLVNLVRGYWPDALQDQVFLKDEPNAAAALALVEKYGVRRAGRLIMKMNE